jgi:SAM-dependent methyltransferase
MASVVVDDTGAEAPAITSVRARPDLETLLLPLLILFPDRPLERLGLPSLRSIRYDRVRRFIGRRHLDLACGENFLQRCRGVDGVFGVDLKRDPPRFNPSVVGDARFPPFLDRSFDSVSMVACLNHFGDRQGVVARTARLLRPGGYAIVTMIGPLVGLVCHKFRFPYQDTLHRTMDPDETDGMSGHDVVELFQREQMACVHRERFLARLNQLFVFQR